MKTIRTHRLTPSRHATLSVRAAILAAWLLSLGWSSPLFAALNGTVFTGPSGAALGGSVGISGDTAVVGASAASTSGGNRGPGSAYVYVRSGGAWTQQAVLTADVPQINDNFGEAVAIEGNTIVVGAPGYASAYVFTRSGTTWTRQTTLKANNPGFVSHFGTAVAISGNLVAVAAGQTKAENGYSGLGITSNGDNSNATGVDGDGNNSNAPGSGAVYLFERHGSRWDMNAYVKASNTGSADGLGSAVALSGETLVVGAFGEDSAASGINGNQADNSLLSAGAAYVFTRVNHQWSQQAYLKADFPSTYQGFGASVAIAGDTIAVGSYDYYSVLPVAGVHIFTRNSAGAWSRQAALAPLTAGGAFGFSVSLWRDTLIVGEEYGANGIGTIHVFRRNSAEVWARESVVPSPSNIGIGGYGFSVAIDGDALAVGSGGDDNNSGGQNKAWLYTGAGAPRVAVEEPLGISFPSGGTKNGATVPGSPADLVFTIRNTGAQSLNLTGTPSPVLISGSADFSITAQPAATLSPDGATTFTVRFAPASTGLKTATLTIPSDDLHQPSYVINLAGRGLSTTDTDGDGLSDAAEFNLASLGFDWQTSQPAQVNSYFANANSAGLYTTSQVQALHVGTPLLQRDVSGQFKLTLGLEKSTTLQPGSFQALPMSAPQTIINGSGQLEFQFTTPDNAAFYRVQASP